MSTQEYRVNGKRYQIGAIGWEGANALSQVAGMIIPTYGLWAGPGWSGGGACPRER